MFYLKASDQHCVSASCLSGLYIIHSFLLFRRYYFSYSVFDVQKYLHKIAYLIINTIGNINPRKDRRSFWVLPCILRLCVFSWEWIPVLWRVLRLLWVLCSGGRGGGCLSGRTTGQNGCLSVKPCMTALRCWLLFPPGGYNNVHIHRCENKYSHIPTLTRCQEHS